MLCHDLDALFNALVFNDINNDLSNIFYNHLHLVFIFIFTIVFFVSIKI